MDLALTGEPYDTIEIVLMVMPKKKRQKKEKELGLEN